MAKQTISMDRRRKERRTEGRKEQSGAPTAGERRNKVQRRRQIDPTTCERDYTDDEIEFMQALDEYKRKNGRMFPTCSEVLEVIRALGYIRVATDSSPAGIAVVGESCDATSLGAEITQA